MICSTKMLFEMRRKNMNIEKRIIKTSFDGKRCYVHARGLLLPTDFLIMTMQKLELSGDDVFYGLEMMKSTDGGKTFSAPAVCKNLVRRYEENGTSSVMCDATPFYHKKTGKIILTGQSARYSPENGLEPSPRKRNTLYAIYNEALGDFDSWNVLEMPETSDDAFFSSGSGSGQILELSSGEVLIPIYYKSLAVEKASNGCYTAAVLRCAFDGEKISVLEVGDAITVDTPRGLYEPSVIEYKGEYFLALRNDVTGFVAKSRDGLHFDKPVELKFDSGENLGNYNTQQHWITGGGKLWLVYTRRAENNGHVFRHRAPLFIAEFCPERMCIIRDTEEIAVPERGARLGNFGCQSYSENEAYVFASEWMQNYPYGWEKCAEYGSDNSIFVCKINF